MADKSKISWTQATWNPVRGCSRISEGCRNCYAERQAARIVRMGKGAPTAYDGIVKLVGGEPRWTGDVRLVPDALSLPLRWSKPRRVFVNSMSDLFHESLSNEQIAAVFGVMAAAPQHTFQMLTKRARRMREWFEWASGEFTERQRGITSAPNTPRALLDAALTFLGEARKPELDVAWRRLEEDVWPLPNVWLGVSVENQAAADERIPELLRTPAAVRFLSCEPLLGPVDLTRIGEFRGEPLSSLEEVVGHIERPALSWVIAGCESGPGARSCDVAWLRSLRDQAGDAGVPFFLKQAAGLVASRAVYPSSQAARAETVHIGAGDGSRRKHHGVIELPYLDGVQWAQFPEVRRG